MSWFFLRAGQSSTHALEVIDRLVLELTSLRGSLDSAAGLAANQYLLWAERAELHLSEVMADRSIPRGLYTERYWRIRVLDNFAVRPHPLIQGEMADQLRSLNDIRQQLAHYEQLLRPREDERLLVCDTNALVHGKRFDTLRWNELFAERKVRIVLPLVVIDELDTIKDRGGSIKNNANRAAGAVLRELDAKLLPGQALQRMELRDNVTLQLVDEPFGHTRLEGHDDEIIRQASYFSSMSEGRTTIVARDRGMRVRAEAAGIDVIPLPLDYERADPEEPFDG